MTAVTFRQDARPVAMPWTDVEAPLSPASRRHKAGYRARLRQCFLKAPDALADHEFLDLLLSVALPRQDTTEMADALITRFGSFADVVSADLVDLTRVPGLGEAAAASLKAVREAAVRLARAPVINRPVISGWDVLLNYCRTAMTALPVEQVRLLFLNRKHVLIADEPQQRGTVDHTPLYPREVVKRALELHASSLIMVHNHPSGDPNPSKSDIETTRMVRDALATVSIA